MIAWSDIGSAMVTAARTLGQLAAERRKQEEAIQAAVSAAFNNTEKYYALRQAGNPRDVEREHDLARDWDHAAVLIKSVDSDLANRLGLKANYWRDGATWSDDQIREAGIQLRRVRAEGMTLFDKPKRKAR